MKSKKALYNIITQLICDIVTIASGLIIPRLILVYYGSDCNGIISSIAQFLEYISFLTLGVSGSTRVAIYRAKGDTTKISRILKSTSSFMRKVAVIFIIYLLAMTFIYPLIVHSSISNVEISLLVLVTGIGVFSEYFWGVTYTAFVSAMQCRYILNIIQIVLRIISTAAVAMLIISDNSIVTVKLIGAIFIALAPLLLNIVVNKKFNITKNVEPDDSALSQRKDAMAHSIANSVHQYTDIFLLTLFSTGKIISVYSVYYMILTSVKKVETLFTNGLEGAFGETWAKGDRKTFQDNFNTFEYLIFSLVSVLFTCCAFLLIPFVKLYTVGITDVEYVVPVFAAISVLAYIIYCLRTPYIVCVQSAGKYKETKKGAFVEAGLNLGISLILVFPLGLVGVAIGTLCANIFRTIQYEMYASKHLLSRTNRVFINRVVWLGFCFGINFAIMYLIFPLVNMDSWPGWIIGGVYCFLISFVVTLLMSALFYRSELLKGIEIVKKMFKRNKEMKK